MMEEFVDIYRDRLRYVTRMLKYKQEDEESEKDYKIYYRGYIEGCKAVLKDITFLYNLEEVIPYRQAKEADHQKYKEDENDVFTLERIYTFDDKEYAVFNDDYGQCFCLKIGDNFYGMGTYNIDIDEEVLMYIIDYEFSKLI